MAIGSDKNQSVSRKRNVNGTTQLNSTMNNQALQSVRVETPRRHNRHVNPERQKVRKKTTQRTNSDFVYVNNAFVGSLNSVNETRIEAPPTSVIREQYWACSKWPLAQRILAVSVGVLLGAVIGLAIALVYRAVSDGELPDIFGSSSPD